MRSGDFLLKSQGAEQQIMGSGGRDPFHRHWPTWTAVYDPRRSSTQPRYVSALKHGMDSLGHGISDATWQLFSLICCWDGQKAANLTPGIYHLLPSICQWLLRSGEKFTLGLYHGSDIILYYPGEWDQCDGQGTPTRNGKVPPSRGDP